MPILVCGSCGAWRELDATAYCAGLMAGILHARRGNDHIVRWDEVRESDLVLEGNGFRHVDTVDSSSPVVLAVTFRGGETVLVPPSAYAAVRREPASRPPSERDLPE